MKGKLRASVGSVEMVPRNRAFLAAIRVSNLPSLEDDISTEIPPCLHGNHAQSTGEKKWSPFVI